MILLGFGIVQIGLSLKSHDPSQRANGFLTLAGGVVITFAKKSLLSSQADEELTQDKITGADPPCGFTPVIQLSKEVVECRIIGLCKT